MVCRRRRRAIYRDDIDARQHLVEAVPIGRFKLLLGGRIDALAVVVVDRQAEGLGAPRDGGADSAHADNTDTLAPYTAAKHPGRRPAGPVTGLIGEDAGTFGQPA